MRFKALFSPVRHGALASAVLAATFSPVSPWIAPPLQAAEAKADIPSAITYELIDTYSVERLNKILTTELKAFTSFEVSYPEAKYPVRLYRVTYPSVIPEQNNRPTTASGLLAIPETGGKSFPVLSYQHGTVFSKTEVPSHPEESDETRLAVAQFAGQGYIVIGADYFGKGISTETDSYLVRLSTQQACLDHLNAAHAISGKLGAEWGPLFLLGWSQGGWVTQQFLNKLESLSIPVKAAATASGPMDMYALINGWIHAPAANTAPWVAGVISLQVNSYERYYGRPGLAQSLIKPEYFTGAQEIYLNKKGWTEGSKGFPEKLADFFTEEAKAASSVGTDWYWQKLKEDSLNRWRTVTPVQVYYGSEDEVIPAYIAALPVAFQKSVGGAETTGIEVEKANHRGTYVYALANAKKWFDSLIEGKE